MAAICKKRAFSDRVIYFGPTCIIYIRHPIYPNGGVHTTLMIHCDFVDKTNILNLDNRCWWTLLDARVYILNSGTKPFACSWHKNDEQRTDRRWQKAHWSTVSQWSMTNALCMYNDSLQVHAPRRCLLEIQFKFTIFLFVFLVSTDMNYPTNINIPTEVLIYSV